MAAVKAVLLISCFPSSRVYKWNEETFDCVIGCTISKDYQFPVLDINIIY